MFELLFTGLYIGALHILSAPDHLGALIPLGLVDKKSSLRVGVLWGLGHLIGLLVIGILLFFFKNWINLEGLSHYGFLYVGFLLIFIGLWVIYRSRKSSFAKDTSHKHSHLSKISLGVGLLHGLLGYSHIYTLAPTLSMNDMDYFAYFGGVSVGGFIAVLGISLLIYFAPEKLTQNNRLYQKIAKISGVIAVVMGVIVIVMFFTDTHSLHMHHHH